MAFEIFKETYKGSVREVEIGIAPNSLKIGGENAPAFHFFEGEWPNPPRFALEVYDLEPKDWPDAVMKPFEEVLNNPVKWAQKCVDSYGAEAICLQLAGTDPIQKDTPPDEAAALTKAVSEAVDVPLVIYGTGTEDKDVQVLRKVAETCAGKNFLLGPASKKNFQEIGKSAEEFGHSVILWTAIEIPEAKELNIKLTKTFPSEKVMLDPLSPAIGYGMEYTYSAMERVKLAGTSFGDPSLRMPLIANIGKACWETTEAKESEEQGILWESLTGLSYLLAGADLLILRHPKSLKLLKDSMGGP